MSVAQNGRTTYVNSSFLSMFGYDRPEQIVGRPILEGLSPRDRKEAMKHLRLWERTGQFPSQFEGRALRKDGSEFPFRAALSSVELEGGPALVCFFSDLSEVRRAEEAVRQSEERYRVLADSTSDLIFSLDGDLRITGLNQVAARSLGLEMGEALGRHLAELDLPEDTRRRWETRCGEVLATGRAYEGLLSEFSLRDGIVHTWETDLRPIRTGDGRVVGLRGATRDVTERKQMEESLLRTQFIIDHSQDLIHWLSPEGRFLYVNDASCRRLGYSREELLGMTVNDIDPDAPRPWSSYFPEIKKRGSFAFESSHRTKDGETFPVEVTVNYVSYGGQEYNCASARDITERRRAEVELTHSHDLMRYIIEHSRSAIAVHDRDLKYVYVSQRYLQDHNLKEKDVIGKHHYDVLPHLPQKWRDVHQKALAGEISSAEDDPVVREDGALDWTRWECRPWYEADGSIGGIIIYTEVITERKQADEALRSSEDRYQNLVNLSPDAIIVNAGGKYVFANPAAARLFGATSPREIVGRGAADMIHPDYRELIAQRVGHVLAGGAPMPREIKVLRLDGASVEVEAIGSRIEFDGSPATQVVLRDITERRQAEARLRLMQRSVDSAVDMVAWIGKDGRLIYVNDAFCRRHGYSREELLDTAIYDIDPNLSPEKWPDQWRGDKERGLLPMEVAHRTKDGEIFPAEVVSHFVEHDGKEYNVGFARDITERKQAEEEKARLQAQLQQAQKMESVGRLAGGVAHDFNNMLGVILGHAEMALEQVDSTQPLHGDLTEIRQAAERSADLTRQLLAFARKQTIAPQVLDLNETVTGMLSMLKRLIGEDIDLCWQPQADLWPVRVDPSQIDQILANLCVNARDAIADVGKMTIETGNSTVDKTYCAHHPGFAPGEYVRLVVSDDGCGMDKETLTHLFEPFFTTKAVGQGTGLGLATVYGIVKQNGGFMDVDSEPDKGTTFTIYLPRQVAKAEQIRKEGPTSPAAQGHETVLVVEDEPAILKISTRMLETQGYTVLAARTPGEAIHLAREHAAEIHLLMTDVVMPEMNGRDLAKNLLSLYPQLKRLFMSGYTADVIAHQGVLDEGVHFIQKPFSAKDLFAKVREALEGE